MLGWQGLLSTRQNRKAWECWPALGQEVRVGGQISPGFWGQRYSLNWEMRLWPAL